MKEKHEDNQVDLFWGYFTAIYCTHFLICVPSSFVGKIDTYRRSEHNPGVRFCKYLLVNLLMVGMSVSAILPLFSVLCPF